GHVVRADPGSRRAGTRLHAQGRRRGADLEPQARHARGHRDHVEARAAMDRGRGRADGQSRKPRAARGECAMSAARLTHFIGGETVAADARLSSINPSDLDDVVATFRDGGAGEVNAAVERARAAFPAWSAASPEARSDLLDQVGAAIAQRSAALAELLAREEGKTLAEATGEVMRAARIFKYFAGEALRRHGQALESTRPGIDVTTHREAVGVYGLITPW